MQVLTNARTTQVAFEKSPGSEPRAVGVEFATDGQFGARSTAELVPGGLRDVPVVRCGVGQTGRVGLTLPGTSGRWVDCVIRQVL